MTDQPLAITRRAALASGAAVGGATLIGASSAYAAPVRVHPRPSDIVVQRYGICIHAHYEKTEYRDHERVTRWLDRLGVRHVRTRLVQREEELAEFEDLAFNHGIKVLGLCGAFGDPETMGSIMRTVRQRYRNPGRIFDGFEGINEPNNNNEPWIAETRRKTAQLFEARRDQGLERIPIVAPSLARIVGESVQGDDTLEQARRLGSLGRYVDVGNMHVYPKGLPPSSEIGYFRRAARIVSPGKPVMCTEGGYFNAMDFDQANPLPERVSAVYAPQQILTHIRRRTRRFYRFELLDAPNPSSTDREGTLGTVRPEGNWSAKPDFWPVQHLLRTMADPGEPYVPQPLELAVANPPRNFRQIVFGRRDGTHVLAMWQNFQVWDTRRDRLNVRSLTEPIDFVDVTLGRRRRVEVQHLTTLGDSEVYRSTRRVRVGLTPGITLVKLA